MMLKRLVIKNFLSGCVRYKNCRLAVKMATYPIPWYIDTDTIRRVRHGKP